ncbi:hypothetical protein V2J09_020716 [Rumex salicifolius]
MGDNTSANCYNVNAYSKSSTEPESEVADFAASMETPDLRNWFSSYVYQSPELTLTYSCEDSFPIEGEYTKDIGLYVEDSEGEEEHTRTHRASVRSNYPSIIVKNIGVDGCSLHEPSDELDQHHKVMIFRLQADDMLKQMSGLISVSAFLEVPENSDSLPSQPPDIRNWFSSYVYESPMLDTAEIGCSLPISIDIGGTEDDIIADKAIQVDAVKRRKLIGCEKSETDSAELENGNHVQISDLPSEAKKLSIPGGISCCLEAFDDEIHDAKPAENHINPRIKDGSNMERIERDGGEIAGFPLCYKNSATSDEATKSEDKASTIDSDRDSGWVLPNSKSKQGNSRVKMSANVNEKKHKPTESAVSEEIDQGMMTTRMPLMEITNVCSSGSNEITGKWRCPQKNKSSIGPPLKQLRLEKWIHRV